MTVKAKARKQRAKAADKASVKAGPLGLMEGNRAAAQDFITNVLARTGLGTSSLESGTQYNITRWTLNFWEVLSFYETSWVARRVVEAPAQDMLRTWPKMLGDSTPEDLAKVDKAIRVTGTKNRVLDCMVKGRLFGGAGALMVIDGQEKDLDQPLDLKTMEIGSFRGLIVFDRWSGITPGTETCTDVNRPLDLGLPEFYDCRMRDGASMRVHSSRILRFCGPMMPEPENSAYSGWGMSTLAPVYQTIVSYDNLSANALSLSFRAQILGMRQPDLAAMLSGLGSNAQATQKFEQRMQRMNHMISNQSLLLLEKDGELSSTQYSFGGLAELMQTFQLQVAGAAKMPVTLLWGRTLNGLGQAGDGDEKIYEKAVASAADTELRPQLEKLYPVICTSALGEVPDDMDLAFPSIRVLTEQEKVDLAKATTDTVMVALNGGLLSPRTAGKELKQSSDATGVFTNITDEALEKLSDDTQAEGEMGEGLFPEGGGLSPSSEPGKVLKEEDKVGPEKPPSGPGAGKPAGKPSDAPQEAVAPSKDGMEGLRRLAARAKDAALPTSCEECGRPIQGDQFFLQHNRVLCPRCVVHRVLAKDVENFKEDEHPRQEDGKFGKKSVATLPKGLEHLKKSNFKNVAMLCTSLLSKGGHSNNDIAQAAQALFGGKTSPASVSWYKVQMKKQTAAGKKEVAAKAAGIKANDNAIASAKPATPPVKEPETVMFASTGYGGKKYKISGVPKDLLTKEFASALLEVKGLDSTIAVAAEFNLNSPASATTDLSATPDEVIKAKDVLVKNAAKQALEAAKQAAAMSEVQKKKAEAANYTQGPVYKELVAKTAKTVAAHPDAQKALKSYSNGGYEVNDYLRKGTPLSALQAAR